VCFSAVIFVRGVVLKKEVRERTYKTSHFQQHCKLILNQYFNDVFTFIALQTENMKTDWERVPTQKSLGTSFPRVPTPLHHWS